MTNESAAGIQQIAKAAEDLNQLTENLQNLVSQFKINNNQQNMIKTEIYDDNNYLNSSQTHLAVRKNGKLIRS